MLIYDAGPTLQQHTVEIRGLTRDGCAVGEDDFLIQMSPLNAPQISTAGGCTMAERTGEN